jgi:hypothetical protein
MSKNRMLLLAAGVALLAMPSLAAEPAPKAVAPVKPESPALADLTQGALFVPESSESDGSVTVEGQKIDYRAVAGTLVVHPKGWDDAAAAPPDRGRSEAGQRPVRGRSEVVQPLHRRPVHQ